MTDRYPPPPDHPNSGKWFSAVAFLLLVLFAIAIGTGVVMLILKGLT
jgi:hypothetical protein